VFWKRYLNRIVGFSSVDETQQMTNALSLASLFAICSFVIAVVTLFAHHLGLVDILQSFPADPPENRIVSLTVMSLAFCVVLTVLRTDRFIDGICTVVLLVALAQLAFPDKAVWWLRALALYSAQPEAVVSTGTTVCLVLLAASLLLRRPRHAVVSQMLCVFAYGAPAMALVGYLLGVQDPHVRMSLTTILMLIPLCVAAGLRSVYRGFLRALLRPTRVSFIARRHLALVMLVPYLIGLGIVSIWPDAANVTFVILFVACSQTVGLVVALLTLSFGNIERRSHILQRRAETRARRDGLTGAMNRTWFMNHAGQEIAYRRSTRGLLSLLFVDLDHFKRINDAYGHRVGDQVLKRVIRIIRGSLRGGDTVARWGGEEFIVLLPSSDMQAALAIAEKIRLRIESEDFNALVTGLHVTVSVGCAEMNGSETLDDLVARADRGLYEAKHCGRNRSVATYA
jgi:diguanylate cyclase (GGDEF)-like protein